MNFQSFSLCISTSHRYKLVDYFTWNPWWPFSLVIASVPWTISWKRCWEWNEYALNRYAQHWKINQYFVSLFNILWWVIIIWISLMLLFFNESFSFSQLPNQQNLENLQVCVVPKNKKMIFNLWIFLSFLLVFTFLYSIVPFLHLVHLVSSYG